MSTRIQNFTFTNNIVSAPVGSAITGTGQHAPCGFQGKTALERLNSCIAPLHFEANVLVGTNDSWPRGNFFPSNPTEVRFSNHNAGNGGDYRLSAKSPHKHRGTDSKDLGADIEAVTKAIVGVRAGVSTPPVN
jgi:hypothetical protein